MRRTPLVPPAGSPARARRPRAAWPLGAGPLGVGALGLAALGAALLGSPSLRAAAVSLIPWTDLTDSDALTSAAVRQASVEGRVIHYPTPTRELAAELERRAAQPGPDARAALRHLAEARRSLGDRAGAEEALRLWAGGAEPASKAAAWAEVARWGAADRSWKLAMEAAERSTASPGNDGTRRAIATERIAWARQEPSAGDPVALLAARAALFPGDAGYAEEWIRALEKAGRTKEAEEALRSARALPEEPRLRVLSDLAEESRGPVAAYDVLEAYVADPAKAPSASLLSLFARRADAGASGKLEGLRSGLEKGFDPRSAVLLSRYFEGKGRSDVAFELLRQLEVRYEKGWKRPERLLLAGLWESIDAVPEAFRSRLAAAVGAPASEQADDLAALAGLALKAGSRPLAWGRFADEPYRWAARVDVTPGFATGGLSLLLTGFDGRAALAELEAARLPERTLATARLLLAELETRKADHPALPGLWVGVMERLVSRGDGAEALKLMPKAERGTPAVRADARRVALLAFRQTNPPVGEELSLWKERLSLLAPEGSVPPGPGASGGGPSDDSEGDESWDGGAGTSRGLEGARVAGADYAPALNEALARLEARDRSHRTSLTLLLGELDRLPRAEWLWVMAVDRIGAWDLDDSLEARYKHALATFEGPEWWRKLARWYVRHRRSAELKALGDEIVDTFRGSQIFSRDPGLDATVPVDGQPNPYVFFSDFLALRALQRFPASPEVLARAEERLLSRSQYDAKVARKRLKEVKDKGVVDDALLATRRNAVLFADAARRGRFVDGLVRDGTLEAFLLRLEQVTPRTPVEDQLLLDGWSRLSRFEKAAPFADALSEAYPGDVSAAATALTLHRSLSAFSLAETAAAEKVVRRAAAGTSDASALWTSLGEMWQDLDRPLPAGDAFRAVLAEAPRDPQRILDVASAFWDYGRPKEALEVLTDGRARLGRPRLDAFEAGVLHEDLKDRDGAIDEYVAALHGEADGEANGEGGEPGGSDFRAQRRLAQLLGRPAIQDLVLARVSPLSPGTARDEETLLAYLPLLSITPEDAVDWDDWMDVPSDPVRRQQRAERNEAQRPAQSAGLGRVTTALREKALAMIPKATSPAFLGQLRRYQSSLAPAGATPGADVRLESLLLAREAELAPTEDARVQKEMARADFLLRRGRVEEARGVWSALLPRVDKLPEGATKIKDLVAHARFLEAAGGDAAGAWRDLGTRYAWSLGVLEDRLEFLFRTGRDAEGLDALEAASSAAAAGHREPLTERLVRESLTRRDTPRARRALDRLLGYDLVPASRVAAAGLKARLAFREDPAFDPNAFAKAESAKLPDDLRPDLWAAIGAAARDEGKLAAGVDLYVEALNRRTDRGWLADACRLAVRAGRSDHLLRFFETQRQRSPRDVRWAVAVREIKTFAGDLPGAIEAAKEATLVAPEREDLTQEAVTLLSRAGRFHEAGDFLETWARSRRADEGVAAWRAGLYVRAGDVARAVEVEREAIKALPPPSADAGDDGVPEPAARTGRAASRFLRLGEARAAFDLAFPGGRVARAREVPLSFAERTEIALRAGRLDALFAAFQNDHDFLSEAAPVIARLALPEQREALQAGIVSRVFRADGTRDLGALSRLAPFAGDAGLDRFDEALAARLLAAVPRERALWGPEPPVAFVRSIHPVVVVTTRNDGSQKLGLLTGDFRREWVAYLDARRDDERLAAALQPLVSELDALCAGPKPVTKEAPFSTWFPVEAFARVAALPERAALRQSVSGWFRTNGAWQRFLAATGSRWNLAPLLPLLDEETRNVWLVRSAPPPPATHAEDPVLAARLTAVERVGRNLAGLIAGRPDALSSTDVVRLRGPRTVGDALGTDARWTWPELAPRPTDGGDDAVSGTGIDRGRLPGRLWGARPGEAWYVLEALASFREKGADAPEVPLEEGPRGDEATRTLLSVRTAEGLGNLPLALALDERGFADLSRQERLERRLRLLVAQGEGGRQKAAALLADEVRKRQGKASEALWRAWERTAEELSLPGPADVLDPASPVAPGLLAFLYDRLGPEAGKRFTPADPASFLSALRERWWEAQERLSPDRAEVFVRDVWTADGGPLPVVAARKLGGFFPNATTWLSGVRPQVRADAYEAVKALPDVSRLSALVDATADRRDAAQVLLLRGELASGSDDAAVARLTRLLERGDTFQTVLSAPQPATEGEGEGETETGGGQAPPAAEEVSVSLLRASYRAFREAKRPAALARAEELLRARVTARLDAGNAGIAAWDLALALAPSPEEKARLLSALERSWVQGEWSDDETLVALARTLARHDRDTARRFLSRAAPASSFTLARERAAALVALRDVEGARAEWVAARARLPLTRAEETRAFDAWRQLGPEPPGKGAAPGTPAAWVTARSFWQRKGSDLESWGAELAAHLAKHPYDRLAARVVLRSLAPAREEVVAPADLAIGGSDDVPGLRIARSVLPRSPEAARFALRSSWISAAQLTARRFPAAEVDGTLADVARIGAATRDAAMADRALSALEDRRAASIAALRKELAQLTARAAPRPDLYKGRGTSVTRVLPRDLTWDLYARVLNGEDVP